MRIFILVCGVLWLTIAGCTPSELENCNPDEAKTLVFDSAGNPAYAGQAMVQMACTSCHGAAITGPGRRGAPSGLDFDMVGSRTNAANAPDNGALDRVRAGRNHVREWRDEMFTTVQDEVMPPGELGAGAFDDAEYTYANDDPLERLNTPEGEEIYANWLACGSPIVERTGDLGTACVGASGEGLDCAIRGEGEPPVATNWPSIYGEIIEPTCATMGCHNEATAVNGMLSLVGMEEARTRIVNASPLVNGCTGEALLVTPGDPNGSYLVQKLEGEPVCGVPMPIRATPLSTIREIQPIRQWILDGAEAN